MSTGKVLHFTEANANLFGDSAPGTSIRVLIDDENDGAPTTVLRMIEIEPGGNSPRHRHNYEHTNFVVEGHGRVLIDEVWHELKPGDAALVSANILHQYVNASDVVFKFLCAIPAKHLIQS
jgi:quercetin dioxygenase-like cupin family protein